MDQQPCSFRALVRSPGGFLPLAMSLLALALIFLGPRVFGDLHSADEGPTAHLWQILIAGQLPISTFLLVKWLRRAARPTLQVLALQSAALFANLAVVFSLGLG